MKRRWWIGIGVVLGLFVLQSIGLVLYCKNRFPTVVALDLDSITQSYINQWANQDKAPSESDYMHFFKTIKCARVRYPDNMLFLNKSQLLFQSDLEDCTLEFSKWVQTYVQTSKP